MKAILAALIFMSAPVFASTQSIFAADGSKATVLLISMTSGDTDASKLYAALDVPEQIISGKRTKRFEFDNASGVRAFSVVCVMSALIEANGTCTVIMHASANSAIDKGALTARFAVTLAEELAKVLPSFKINPNEDLIFATSDGLFKISVASAANEVLAFEINYR